MHKNAQSKAREIIIRNAKRGTVYIDPRVYYERTLGMVNSTIAHECFHWYRHQPYHALMKMIGEDDDLGKAILCAIETNSKNTEKWKSTDWMEWQANVVALKILMPAKPTKEYIDLILHEYNCYQGNHLNAEALEAVIKILSEYYGVSQQAVKNRMRELGYSVVDGVCAYVDGRHIKPYAFLKNRYSITRPLMYRQRMCLRHSA